MRIHRRVPYLAFVPLIALSACGGNSTGPKDPPPTTTQLSVRVSTTGEDLDLSAYVVTVGEDRRRIELNAEQLLSPFPAGTHTVRLDDVAGNCSVGGGATRQVSVQQGRMTEVAFAVTCAALPPGSVDVTGTWIGTVVDGSITYSISYVLQQDGDDVTASSVRWENQNSGNVFNYDGVGRVSGSTLTLFYHSTIGGEPAKSNATHAVSGDQMTGNSAEQLGGFSRTLALTRQ